MGSLLSKTGLEPADEPLFAPARPGRYVNFLKAHWPRILAAVVLMVAGAMFSLVIFLILHQREEHEFESRVSLVCQERAAVLRALIAATFKSMDLIGGFFCTRIGFLGTTRLLADQSAFESFGAFSRFFPQLSSIAVVERVSAVERGAWEQENGFTIKERVRNMTGDLHLVDSPSGNSSYFPLIAYFPTFSVGTFDLRGWDLWSTRRSLLESTILAGIPTANGRMNVLGNVGYGITVAVPFYATPFVPESAKERWSQFRGAIIGVLPMAPLVEIAATSYPDQAMQLTVWDGTSDPEKTYLASSTSKPGLTWLPLTMKSTTMQFGRRHYLLQCVPSTSMQRASTTSQPVILAVISGLLFTLPLLMLFAWFVYSNLTKALQKAKELAIANQEKKEALELMKHARIEAERQSAVKTDFAGYVFHELRNPLHAISAMVDFMMASCHVQAEDGSGDDEEISFPPESSQFNPLTSSTGLLAPVSSPSLSLSGSGLGANAYANALVNAVPILDEGDTKSINGPNSEAAQSSSDLAPSRRSSSAISTAPSSRRSSLSMLTKDESECLQTIWSSVKLMNTIIDDALDMSKIEAGAIVFRSASFDVREVIGSVMKIEERNSAVKGLKMFSHIDPAIPGAVYGDQGRLQQVLLNLLGNAVKFTETGHVSLCVTLAQSRPHVAEQSATVLRSHSDHCESWKTFMLHAPEADVHGKGAHEPGSITSCSRTEEVIEVPRPLLASHSSGPDELTEHPSHRHCLEVCCHCETEMTFPVPKAEERILQLRECNSVNIDVRSPSSSASNESIKHDAASDVLLPDHSSQNRKDPFVEEEIYLQFTVSDTGPGIDPDFVPALFKPYSRAKLAVMKDHFGAGLGLSIVSRIVDILRGTIQIATSLGHGSSFRVTIPYRVRALPEEEPSSYCPGSSSPSRSLGSISCPLYPGRRPSSSLSSSLRDEETDEQCHEVSCRESLRHRRASGSYVSVFGEPDILFDRSGSGNLPPTPLSRHSSDPENHHPATREASLNAVANSLSTDSDSVPLIVSSADAETKEPIATNEESATSCSLAQTPSSAPQMDKIVSHEHVGLHSDQGAVPESTHRSAATKEFDRFKNEAVLLIVDDATVNLKILTRMLEGFKMVTAVNGEEAVQAVRQRMNAYKEALRRNAADPTSGEVLPHPQFSAIFCDVIMPKMDGVEATQIIRKMEEENHLPPVPIAALTAQAMLQDRERCLCAGMDFFIAKPYTRKDLINTLRKICHLEHEKSKQK